MLKSQIVGLALNHQKWPQMGPEWSPGPENRPPGMPRPFPSLWDHSRGQKSAKKVKKSLVWGLALGSCSLILWFHRSEGLARTRLFHPWGREPEGGWSGPGVPCRTLSDLDRGQAPNWSKIYQNQPKTDKINQSQHVEIWGCQF